MSNTSDFTQGDRVALTIYDREGDGKPGTGTVDKVVPIRNLVMVAVDPAGHVLPFTPDELTPIDSVLS